MKLSWKTTEDIRNDMSLPDVWWIKYIDHVNAVESSWADADKAVEAMRAACIAAVEAMDIHGSHPYRGIIDCNCIGPNIVAALREVNVTNSVTLNDSEVQP